MAAANTPEQRETELEREARIFDSTESANNEAVLAQALAAQVAERARCAQLRGEVAGSEEMGGLSASGEPSPQDFAKAWKKIGSVKENKDWNEMEREVRNSISFSNSYFLFHDLQDCNNCVAKSRQCERSTAGKCRQCAEDHGKCSWVQDFRRWRVKAEFGWSDATIDEALRRGEGSVAVVATPGSVGGVRKVASKVGGPRVVLTVPESPSRPSRGKRTRARSRSPTPGPSTSKRRVVRLVETPEEDVATSATKIVIPKKRSGSLRDQLSDADRELERAQRILTAAQNDGEGWRKEVEAITKDYERVKRRLVAQRAKAAGLSRESDVREDMERELATLRQQVAEPGMKTLWVEKSRREAELERRMIVLERELETVRATVKGEFSLI